jgi:small subunit ribosomal protein S8
MNQKSFLNLQNILKVSKQTKPSIVKIKFSKKSLEILSVLLKEGFIRGYFLEDKKSTKNICILLKYTDDINILNLKSIQLKQQRKYISVKELKTYYTAFNLLILSTKKGTMSHLNAINLNIGGFPMINII